MRTLFLIAALAAASFAADNPSKAPLPRKAPEFVIQMPDGTQKLLSSYRGKVVAMAFMFTTCPHCQNTAKLLSLIQTEYAAKGVQVLGVTFDQDAAQRVLQFDKGLGLNFPTGYSKPAPVLEFLGIPPTNPYFVPGLVFIDKAGNIRSQFIGDEKFLGEATIKSGKFSEAIHGDVAQINNIKSEIDKLLLVKKVPAAKN